MKRIFFIAILITGLSLHLCAQTYIHTRITNGYIDKNPSFASKLVSNYGHNNFEFLAFERWSNVNTSHICVLKMGPVSPIDSVIYLTQNGTLNKNPSIAYNFSNISKAMIVWQSYTNGRWNIYGSAYLSGIWSQPFPIDTGAGNKNKPGVILIENSSLPLFGIVYEKENDIIFKRFDAAAKLTLYEDNLTSTDTAVCRNPIVTKYCNMEGKYYVCYEKQKPDGNFAIYYRLSGYPYNWSNPDTLAYLGNNRNVKTMSFFEVAESFTFESNRTGKWGIYQTYWYYSSGWRFVQSLISASQTSSYLNYVSFCYPVVTDGWALMNAVLNKTSDSSRVLFSGGTGFSNPMIIPLGDSSKTSVLTMGNGIFINNPNFALRVWLVYSKDSAGYSMLYAYGPMYIFTEIKKIGTETPEGFGLEQNYPNPFNAVTSIKFKVTSGGKQVTSDKLKVTSDKKQVTSDKFKVTSTSPYPLQRGTRIVLKVFDLAGREIRTLVNEELNPGIYEVRFDAGDLPSGIYFYRMETGKFSDTKKLILLK